MLSRKKINLMNKFILLFVPVICYGQSFIKDAEYYSSGGLDLINAAYAYEHGFTGKGQVIGISDTPVNLKHPDFSQKANSLLKYNFRVKQDGIEREIRYSDYSYLTHGSHVAGIAAAARNGIGIQGVAYDADLISSASGEVSFYGTGSWKGGPRLGAFTDPRIKVVNMSWGNPSEYLDNIIIGDWGSLKGKADEFLDLIKYGKLIVVAAGNSGVAGSSNLASFGIIDDALFNPNTEKSYDSLYNTVLATIAINNKVLVKGDSNNIRLKEGVVGSPIVTDFSNGAKYAEDMSIAAPGSQIQSSNPNFDSGGGMTFYSSGTSQASPFVAGSAVLVSQAFPYLNARQIADVLTSTANKNIEVKPADDSYVVKINDIGRFGKLTDITVSYMDTVTPKDKKTLFKAILKQLASIAKYNGKTEFFSVVFNLKEGNLKTALTNAYHQLSFNTSDEAFNTFVNNVNMILNDNNNLNNLDDDLEHIYIQVNYNTPIDEIIGFGLVDLSKAINGIATLNARRMDPDDKWDAADFANNIGVDLKKYESIVTPKTQMMYLINTIGYDSTYSNDISEVREGLISQNSSQSDLRKRREYYRNWMERKLELSNPATQEITALDYIAAHFDPDPKKITQAQIIAQLQRDNLLSDANKQIITEAINTALYVKKYNDYVRLYGMDDLPVGLFKNGEGKLTLLGKNTYKGDTIVAGGELQIYNQISGDAYSVMDGVLRAKGVIKGNLINDNLSIAGDENGNGNASVNNLISTPKATLAIYPNTKFNVLNTAWLDNTNVKIFNFDANKTYTLLTAPTIKANIANNYAFLDIKANQNGNDLQITLTPKNNIDGLSESELNTINGLLAIDNKEPLMQKLLYLNKEDGKDVVYDLASPVLNLFLARQYSSSVFDAIKDRYIKFDKNIALWSDVNQNWSKFGRVKQNKTSLTVGLSKINDDLEIGILGSFANARAFDDSVKNKSKEYAIGLYSLYKANKFEFDLYLNQSFINNDYTHNLNVFNLSTEGALSAKLTELGMEYRYLTGIINPYVNLQLSRYTQDGYKETGGSIFNRTADKMTNDYLATQIGVDFNFDFSKAFVKFKAGYKHVFLGYNAKVKTGFEGNLSHRVDTSYKMDQDLGNLKLTFGYKFNENFFVAANLLAQKGKNTSDLNVGLNLSYRW